MIMMCIICCEKNLVRSENVVMLYGRRNIHTITCPRSRHPSSSSSLLKLSTCASLVSSNPPPPLEKQFGEICECCCAVRNKKYTHHYLSQMPLLTQWELSWAHKDAPPPLLHHFHGIPPGPSSPGPSPQILPHF